MSSRSRYSRWVRCVSGPLLAPMYRADGAYRAVDVGDERTLGIGERDVAPSAAPDRELVLVAVEDVDTGRRAGTHPPCVLDPTITEPDRVVGRRDARCLRVRSVRSLVRRLVGPAAEGEVVVHVVASGRRIERSVRLEEEDPSLIVLAEWIVELDPHATPRHDAGGLRLLVLPRLASAVEHHEHELVVGVERRVTVGADERVRVGVLQCGDTDR